MQSSISLVSKKSGILSTLNPLPRGTLHTVEYILLSSSVVMICLLFGCKITK